MMEFRPMRRKRQELAPERCIEILQNGTAGVLSVMGDGGYPYGVPLSYAYKDGKIYFHSALTADEVAELERHAAATGIDTRGGWEGKA